MDPVEQRTTLSEATKAARDDLSGAVDRYVEALYRMHGQGADDDIARRIARQEGARGLMNMVVDLFEWQPSDL